MAGSHMTKTARYLLPVGWRGKNGFEKLAETIERICRMINGLNFVEGGDVFVDKDKIELRARVGAANLAFNGIAYTPTGVVWDQLTNTNNPWLKYDLSTGIITEQIGPPSEPWGSNEVWRKKADFTGSIYF